MSRACSTSPKCRLEIPQPPERRESTMDKMTTHGKLRDATIARANEVFPDPELPAIPIMLVFAHGGE
jgi:hypothetical protein